MSEPVHVALVGYGMAGKVFHAPLIRVTEGLVLSCVVSSDARKVHADIPGMDVVADLDIALRDPKIGLVVLATPDHLHAPQALAALDAGKPLVIDKPFAPSLAEARAIAARATERNLMLTVFQNRRWDGDYLTVKRLIAERALGDIVQFESHFDRLQPVRASRWQDARAAGVWQDLGPHLVDQALQLFGMPLGITADIAQQRSGSTSPDYAHVVLRYERLRVILHMSRSTHASGLRFAVHGTHGSYISHGLDPQENQSKAGLTPRDPRWGVDLQPGTLTRVDAHGAAQETIVESARGDYPAFYAQVRDALGRSGSNPVPVRDALNVMAILEAGKASAADFGTCNTVEPDNADRS